MATHLMSIFPLDPLLELELAIMLVFVMYLDVLRG